MNDVVATTAIQALEGQEVMNDYLIFQLGEQAFCIHVGLVRDVLRMQKLTQVPLSDEAVSGVMNLRGHIVTAVDARVALGIPKPGNRDEDMSVVVEFEDYLYSIIVDSVRDVITFESDQLDTNPSILEGKVRDVSKGVIKFDSELIICLDVASLFEEITRHMADDSAII